MAGTRKIAAILVADIVGYSRLAGVDEERTLARLRGLRSDLIDPTIAVHNGRVVKRTGDGSLIEFRSVVDAVGIVTSSVFTAYYLLLRTKRIERVQWVNELTKGGVRAFTGRFDDAQPPVAPGNPIGVAATDQIPFADHSNQLQVRREHGNGAYALLQQQDRDIPHAGPDQHGNDILRHDLAGAAGGFYDSRLARLWTWRFVSHAALSPRRESAAYSAKRAPWAWPRDVFMFNAADKPQSCR